MPSAELTKTLSLAERLAIMPAKVRRAILAGFSDEEMGALEHDWSFWRRPSQAPPPGDEWFGWLIVTGRGWGKTRTAGEYAVNLIRSGQSARSGFIARTSGDIRDVVVEGESGVQNIAPPDFRPNWEPSKRRLTWPNGALTHTYSAEEPDLLRGPQHDFIWADEVATWKYRATWDNAMLGLRIGARPHWVATTTPKPVPLMRELFKLVDQQQFFLTSGSTYENMANLAMGYIAQVVKPMEGTRLSRQELHGKMVEDAQGALWTAALLEDSRVTKHPPLRYVMVGVDPEISSEEGSAETGIAIGGLGDDGKGYLLDDVSRRGQPHEWATAAVAAFHKHSANKIIAETNNGGDMVIATILSVDPSVPVEKIAATRGKYTRAEPVSSLYQQGLIKHVGYFPELEDQMRLWVPGEKSPDRLDALVWVFTKLMVDIKRLRYGKDFGIA